jgi:hypothetical protein
MALMQQRPGSQRAGRRRLERRASCWQSASTVPRSRGARGAQAARRARSSGGRAARARARGAAPRGRSLSDPNRAPGATERAAAARASTSMGRGTRAFSYRESVAGSIPMRSASSSCVHPALRRRSRRRRETERSKSVRATGQQGANRRHKLPMTEQTCRFHVVLYDIGARGWRLRLTEVDRTSGR